MSLPIPKAAADGANPRLHNEVYPFISPSKFKGALKDKVVIITGTSSCCSGHHSSGH